MKIVINETGKTEEVSEKVASRLINKGTAHYPEKQKVVSKTKEEVSEIDLIQPISEQFISFEKPKKPQKKSRRKKSKIKAKY